MTLLVIDGLVSAQDSAPDDLAFKIFIHDLQTDIRVTKFRGSSLLRGRHSYKITDKGIVAYPRVGALFANPSQAGKPAIGRATSGIARLDDMLHGGLPTAATTTLMGPSGIGKTTVGLHFLSGSSAAEPGLLFPF